MARPRWPKKGWGGGGRLVAGVAGGSRPANAGCPCGEGDLPPPAKVRILSRAGTHSHPPRVGAAVFEVPPTGSLVEGSSNVPPSQVGRTHRTTDIGGADQEAGGPRVLLN